MRKYDFKVKEKPIKSSYDNIYAIGGLSKTGLNNAIDIVYKTPVTRKNDLLIILGDAALEYTSFCYDKEGVSHEEIFLQKLVNKYILPQIVCIQGDNEVPFHQMHGKDINFNGAKAKMSCGIIFIRNGETFTINNKKFLVLGGAQSYCSPKENKMYFTNSEMSSAKMKKVFDKIKGQHFDFVLSHTCPISLVDLKNLPEDFNSETYCYNTEAFLQYVKENITYDTWLSNHLPSIEEHTKNGSSYYINDKIKYLGGSKSLEDVE